MQKKSLYKIADQERFIEECESKGYRFGNAYPDRTMVFEDRTMAKPVIMITHTIHNSAYHRWCGLING